MRFGLRHWIMAAAALSVGFVLGSARVRAAPVAVPVTMAASLQ